jgi:AcrR family transcriptional regulator
MTNCRTQKTKQKLRDSLLLLLQDAPFEHLSVTDLCKASGVSRITFYAYYNDKFDLISEIFEEMLHTAIDFFEQLQTDCNPEKDSRLSCRHLLQAILMMEKENQEFMVQIVREENSYLAFAYYWYVMRKVFNYSRKYVESLCPVFSVQMTVNFLCTGMWGFIRTGVLEGKTEEEIGILAGQLLDSILASPIFQ